MRTWTPTTPYEPGDVVTVSALVDEDFTWPERMVLAATLLVAFCAAAFALMHIWQIHDVMLEVWPLRIQGWIYHPNEIRPQVALLAAALLLAIGVSLIVDWRRKRRESRPWKFERIGGDALDPEMMAAIRAGALPGWRYEEIPEPATELQRHLSDALAVLLREPSLTIDAGTLRMLAKHKAKRALARDEKGRWRSVQ